MIGVGYQATKWILAILDWRSESRAACTPWSLLTTTGVTFLAIRYHADLSMEYFACMTSTRARHDHVLMWGKSPRFNVTLVPARTSSPHVSASSTAISIESSLRITPLFAVSFGVSQ